MHVDLEPVIERLRAFAAESGDRARDAFEAIRPRLAQYNLNEDIARVEVGLAQCLGELTSAVETLDLTATVERQVDAAGYQDVMTVSPEVWTRLTPVFGVVDQFDRVMAELAGRCSSIDRIEAESARLQALGDEVLREFDRRCAAPVNSLDTVVERYEQQLSAVEDQIQDLRQVRERELQQLIARFRDANLFRGVDGRAFEPSGRLREILSFRRVRWVGTPPEGDGPRRGLRPNRLLPPREQGVRSRSRVVRPWLLATMGASLLFLAHLVLARWALPPPEVPSLDPLASSREAVLRHRWLHPVIDEGIRREIFAARDETELRAIVFRLEDAAIQDRRLLSSGIRQFASKTRHLRMYQETNLSDGRTRLEAHPLLLTHFREAFGPGVSASLGARMEPGVELSEIGNEQSVIVDRAA